MCETALAAHVLCESASSSRTSSEVLLLTSASLSITRRNRLSSQLDRFLNLEASAKVTFVNVENGTKLVSNRSIPFQALMYRTTINSQSIVSNPHDMMI